MFGDLFTRNIGKKVLALLLAVTLWFIANIEQNVQKTLTIDIIYDKLSPGLVIMNNPPQKLKISVRGTRGQLSTLSAKSLSYVLDLSNVTPGVSRFEIHPDQVKVPRGIQIVGLTPAEIKLEVDRLVKKKVKVNPVIGPPDSGFEIVGEPVVNPKTVVVEGPNKILYSLKAIPTDTVSTSGVKSDFTIEVPLKTPPLVKVLKHDKVKVTVFLREIVSRKEFKDLKVDLSSLTDKWDVQKDDYTVDLVFEGPYNIIKGLKSENIKVYVDGSEIGASGKGKTMRVTLKVKVTYPFNEKIRLVKQKPKSITLRLRRKAGGEQRQ